MFSIRRVEKFQESHQDECIDIILEYVYTLYAGSETTVENLSATERRMEMGKQKLVEAIATAVLAHRNCIQSNNEVWMDRWTDRLGELEKLLPSGSGIDSGTKIHYEACSDSQVSLYSHYHVMNGDGFYVGWLSFDVTAKSSFIYGVDIDLKLGAWDGDDDDIEQV